MTPTTRLALRLAYEGSHHPGWQTQPGGVALQDHLERALSQVAAHPVSTICAGRTDAGVHALAQVVHFETTAVRPESAWLRGVNSVLPPQMAAQAVRVVDEGFHARHGALRRSYRYVLLRATHRHPLLAQRTGWVFRPLDVARMREAAAHLVGTHDFSAFRSSQCQAHSPVRVMESIHVHEEGALVHVDLCANAFLHHMVRNIVGALVWIGAGRRPADWTAELLASKNRRLAAPTFAAEGLYLNGVEYPAQYDIGSWPPRAVPISAP